MYLRRFLLIAIAFFAVAAGYRLNSISADEWLPISPEELKMTSDAGALGAPAIILYRQVDRDDSNARMPHEYNYVREKIFTEEGRKYADVEIPFIKDQYKIINIRARTVHPDGTSVVYDGKVYEKEIVKARGFKYLAKTFTLSDVQPGGIIEYHYMIDFEEGYVFDSNWILSSELFTKSAKFTLKPYGEWPLQWSWPNSLPAGTKPPVDDKGTHNIHMEAQNIPAFLVEDDMPPEASMKFRVDFTYKEDGAETDVDKYWKKQGKKINDYVEGFVNKKKVMEQAVAETVAASDSPDAKLRKIYERVQKIRKLSFEMEKTGAEKESVRKKKRRGMSKMCGNVDTDTEMTLRYCFWEWPGQRLSVSVSAAKIATRDDHFFVKNLMKVRDLRTYVVVVKLNGKDMYFDPGTAFAPFGLLPWSETWTSGLKLDKDGGTWITTPLPESGDSQIERKADLKLTQEGSLEGKLTVRYSGLEGMFRRLEERNEDEAQRKKLLEDDVRYAIPASIEVELTNKPDWSSSDPNLVAEFDLKVPGWASGAGRRALMAVGLFGATEKHMCEHTTRVHPMYFHYPSEKVDKLMIDLPLGWQVSSVPQPATNDAKVVAYTMKVENNKGTLHVETNG